MAASDHIEVQGITSGEGQHMGDGAISNNVTISGNYTFKRTSNEKTGALNGGQEVSGGDADKMRAFIALNEQGVADLTAAELKEIAGMDGAAGLSVKDFEDAGLRKDVAEDLFGAVQSKLNTDAATIATTNFTPKFTPIGIQFQRTKLDENGLSSGTRAKEQLTFVPEFNRLDQDIQTHLRAVALETPGLKGTNNLDGQLSAMAPADRKAVTANFTSDLAERMTRTEGFTEHKAAFNRFMPQDKLKAAVNHLQPNFDPFDKQHSAQEAKRHSGKLLDVFKGHYNTGLASQGYDRVTGPAAAFEAVLNHPGLTTQDKAKALHHVLAQVNTMQSDDPKAPNGRFNDEVKRFVELVNKEFGGEVGEVDFARLYTKVTPDPAKPNEYSYVPNDGEIQKMVAAAEANTASAVQERAAVLYNTFGGNK
jgi:hypothetical protein